jgi:diguanylate cyclase (GGDEF)-like protein
MSQPASALLRLRLHPVVCISIGFLLIAITLIGVALHEIRQRTDSVVAQRFNDFNRQELVFRLFRHTPGAELTLQNTLQALADEQDDVAKKLYLLNGQTGIAAMDPGAPRLIDADEQLPQLKSLLANTEGQKGRLDSAENTLFWLRLPDSPMILIADINRHAIQTEIAAGFAVTMIAVSLLFAGSAGTVVWMTIRAARREKTLRQTAEQLALHDPLTGLLNRRAIEKRFNELKAYTLRQDARLGMLLIDADHFKRVNEQLGRANGDLVLKGLARQLNRTLRESDAVGRVGGEVFLVLLSGNPNLFLGIAAERFRQKIEQASFDIEPEGQVSVTISIGAHLVDLANENLDMAMSIADRALYRAKAQGRNRVVLSSALAPRPPSKS